MRHLIPIAALAGALLFAPDAGAARGKSAASPVASTAGPVRVEQLDRSVDRCWTNLEQAETYAEDRLEQNGFQVVREEQEQDEVPPPADSYVLYVGVIADRVNGSCTGTLQIFLAKPSWRDEGKKAVLAGPDTSRISARKSADVHILGKLRQFIERM